VSAQSTNTYAQTVLADHPILYYQLSEPSGAAVAIDSSGLDHKGTYANYPGLGVPALICDPANTAANFTSGEAIIPNFKDLNFVNAPFTLEAWVNVTGFAAKNMRVFDKADAGYPVGYGLDLAANNVRLLGCQNFAPAIDLSVATTYYIVGVSDGAGTGSIYVNGSLVMSGQYTACQDYGNIGHIAVANNGSSHFNGVIDEAAVYNYALPADRISAHYQAGTCTTALPR
jgi:hypothetical protein